jgi:EpsD family peptidyl-prolyl cis-trans isomerase
MQLTRLLFAAILFSGAFSAPANATFDDRKGVASGKTQVVARAGGRELTLTDLRLEMARLGLLPADPNSERIALESLVARTLLAKAAREANLHRKPDAMARMYAAQDQALADYYLAIASQPPEPTRPEIDAYITANPSLFGGRRAYDFLVLTLDSKNFREDALTPLFDRDADFSRLTAVLAKAGAPYSLASATQSGAAFPPPIREQLSKYAVRDNIVLKGDHETQIMKITAVRDDKLPAAEWGPLARQLMLQEDARKRSEALLARLKKNGEVAYFRGAAAPKPAASTRAK